MSPVDLSDYVDVKERIRLFYEKHADGRLVTAEVWTTREPDDVPRVWVKAYAYRDPSDIHPGVGHSYLSLPGTSPYTKNSEVENAETSAWGRAIGALGIGIKASIATTDEIQAKKVEADVDHGSDGSLIGMVEVGDRVSSDFMLRNTPDGPAIGFRLKGDKGGILVRALGQLARDLDQNRESVVGHRATCWGRIATESFTPKGKQPVSYQVLHADRIAVAGIPQMPTVSDASFDAAEALGL